MALAHELKRLRYEHAEMQALADQMKAILALDDPQAAAHLPPLWQQYQKQLTRHLKCEDWILYPRIAADMPENLRRIAGDIMREFGHLAQAVEQHGQKWSSAPEPSQWPAYQAGITMILQIAEQRAAREEADLFPMLAFAYDVRQSAA